MHRNYEIRDEKAVVDPIKSGNLSIKKLIFVLLILILSLIFLLAMYFFNSEKFSSTEELKKVKVAEVTRSVFYAPQYVADSLGFFKKNGIMPEFIVSDGSDKTMTSVLSHAVDIGLAGSEMVFYVKNEGMENHPIIFAQLTRKDGSFLIGRKNSCDEKNTSFSVENLKRCFEGEKSIIAGRPGGLPFMSLEYVLKKIGAYEKVKLLNNVKFELMAPSFCSGMGDFVMLFEPAVSKLLDNKNTEIVASMGEIIGETCYTCYFANSDFIKNNHDLIQKFVESIYEGQIWVKNHDAAEIAHQIKDYFPDSDEKILTCALENYKKVGVWSENPVISKESAEKVLEIIEESQGVSVNSDFFGLVENSFAENSVKKFADEGA